LLQVAQDSSAENKRRRKANLALLSTELADVDFLGERLLTGEPDEVGVVAHALRDYDPEMGKGFWEILKNREANADRRLRAACALAVLDPGSNRWAQVSRDVAGKLVTEPLGSLPGWEKDLEPVGERLVQPLVEIVGDSRRSETEQSVAAKLLARYAR